MKNLLHIRIINEKFAVLFIGFKIIFLPTEMKSNEIEKIQSGNLYSCQAKLFGL